MASPSLAEASAAAPLRLSAPTLHEAAGGVGLLDSVLRLAWWGAAGAPALDLVGLRGDLEA